jgi:hypothetical protein
MTSVLNQNPSQTEPLKEDQQTKVWYNSYHYCGCPEEPKS